MPRLREILTDAGLDRPRTLLQSGNVAVASEQPSAMVASTIHDAIEREWGYDLSIVMRSPAQLAGIVAADPFGTIADDLSRYAVGFASSQIDDDILRDLDDTDFTPEQFTLHGSELYAWAPGGLHASRVVRRLERAIGRSTITWRNWRTVCALLDLAES